MSAIAGLLYLDSRPADRAAVEAMMEKLAHRSLDGSAVWVRGNVGLGHGLLQSTPESVGEKMPLLDSSGSTVLTADARLDNRSELASSLGIGGPAARRMTDSDFILAAWEKWGERCPEHLLGDFAFAIWDERRRSLFCARDHSGVRPLFYYHSDRLFAFASEIKALFSLPEVPRRLNEVKLADFLVGFYEDKVITFYQDILRLPPAHHLTIAGGKPAIRSYWELDPTREIRMKSTDEYVEAFREIFSRTVECRLRCQALAGTQLSGGLDSSSITCVARQHLKQKGMRLHTFSSIFPTLAEVNQSIDERQYVDAVVRMGDIEPHYLYGDTLSPLVDLLWKMDEHVNIPNIYMEDGLYRLARQENMRVVLSGHDGDVVVSYGLEYLEWLARRGRWLKLWKESGAVAQRFGWKPQRMAWQFGIRPLMPEWAIKTLRRLKGRSNKGSGVDEDVISPEFMRRIGLMDRLMSFNQRVPAKKRTLRDDHARAMPSGLDLFGLEFFNQLGAQFGIEPRFPFFDRRLMEFCLAIPFDQKLSQGRSRLIFRRAMEGILPPEVQNRFDKGNLSGNFSTKLLERGRSQIEDIIFQNPKIIEPYVDLDAVRGFYRKFLEDPLKASQPAFKVFLGVSLALWLKDKDFS